MEWRCKMTRRLPVRKAGAGDEIPPAAVVAMLIRGVEAARSSVATVKAGPDAFCSRFGFTDEEAGAVWHLLTEAGCARVGFRDRIKVNAACLAALVPALRRVHAEAVQHESRV